ncbi:MAG: hotdog fold domain-containing protein [Pseudomonadota bacterium]
MSDNRVLNLWQRHASNAFGRWLFSRIVCLRAPYFGSIRPVFTQLQPGRAEARIKKRRPVTNHLGTVHAIAMANLCELVAGTGTEVSVPASMRWIPKGMTIEYLAKATTNVRAVATIPDLVVGQSQDIKTQVEVFDSNDTVVVRADITMYVSAKQRS